MGLRDFFFRMALKPKVLHSLPGRLRVHFPLLKQLPAGQHGLADRVGQLLTRPEGITSVEVTPETGNLLVEYEEGLSETQIVGYLEGITQILLRARDRLAAVPQPEIPAVIDRLAAVIHRATRPGLDLDTEVSIPDDVWS